jgi:hypothetical protein
MIFMRGLLAGMEMTNAAERDGHAADAGVIVGQRAQGGPDELYEVRMVWEEGVLPERSERFSAIPVIMRKTKRFAEGLTLFLGGASSWLVLWLSESSLVSLARINIVRWNFCLVLRVSTSQRI